MIEGGSRQPDGPGSLDMIDGVNGKSGERGSLKMTEGGNVVKSNNLNRPKE